jgi:hypothetical protein
MAGAVKMLKKKKKEVEKKKFPFACVVSGEAQPAFFCAQNF